MSGEGKVKEKLSEQETLTDAEWEEKARKIVLRKLDYRAHTKSELATALAEKGVPDGVAEQLLSRFEQVGLIDDQAFALAWVSSRHRSKGLAPKVLKLELRRRGVADEIIEHALDQIDPDVEYSTALYLVRLRASRLTQADFASAEAKSRCYRRLAGVLARKGYPPGLVNHVVSQVICEFSATNST